jgi:epoxyqueuosine reductase
MHWLERSRDRILDANRLLPGVRGVTALGVDYGREEVLLPGGGRVARYAAGRDYHRVLGGRLRRLKGALVREGLPADSFRGGVDAVPILERALSVQAGIGFLAKSSGVISPSRGPWLLLAELLTRQELPADGPAPGTCGTCTACLDACPTGAIVAPFEVDARRCISYSTIEIRGPIPRELRRPQADWLFGCDICIEVCPFSDRSQRRSEDPDLAIHGALETFDLVGILELSAEDYETRWLATAMRRARREGLRRNAAIVLGNLGREDAAPALVRALSETDPGLRTAAAWALARLRRGRAPIEAALARETDPEVRDDLQASLAEM